MTTTSKDDLSSTAQTEKKNELLEPTDDANVQGKIERMLNEGDTSSVTEKDKKPKERPVMRIDKKESVLSQVRDFLPKMEKANAELEAKINESNEGKDSVNIENVGEDEQHIEMNLGVGVFDVKPKEDNDHDTEITEDNIRIPGMNDDGQGRDANNEEDEKEDKKATKDVKNPKIQPL
eukprot:Clim_evm52s201 gene=Clim_evmTU52s201